MKNKYSIFSLIKNSFTYHENWQKAWKDPVPKSSYDVVIIGGGGHGLSTAYYLAKEHNLKKLTNDQGREEIRNIIRKELRKANEKDQILATEDREILKKFISKIQEELSP